jgi:hypothetical protein
MSSLVDPLAEQWEESIAALPTQAERDEVTAFIQNYFRPGAGTGIMRSFFLLLKANRCHLEKQPERLRKEFYDPLAELMQRLEKSLTVQYEGQKAGITAMERSGTQADKAAQRVELIVPKVEGIVQAAFDRIQTESLTKKITHTVVKSAVEPVAKTNEKLGQTLELLDNALVSIQETMKVLRNFSLPTIVGVAFIAALLLCGSISACIIGRMGTAYDRKLAAAVASNGDAFAELAQLRAKIEIMPQGDAEGNPIPGHYALSLENAEAAQMKRNDPRGRGLIFFQASPETH